MRSHRTFLVILALYLALAVAYSAALPLAEAPDEADHYAYIVYLGQNRSLPEGTAVTQGKHPPLYHGAAAALTGWTGLDFTFLRSNPDALPLGPGSPPNFFVHTTLEDFPWRGGALAMHLARLFSVALGAVTLWAAWRLGLEVFPQRPAIGLIAAAFLAGLPGFLFISGSVNNDNAAAMFGALALLLCAAMVQRGLRWRRSLLLGVVLGLGLLSKVGTLALWPLAALAIGGVWWIGPPRRQRGGSAALAMGHAALVYGLAVLVASPWLLRNWQLYGDPLAWELVRATVDQRLEPLRLADIAWLVRGFHTSFWGRFAAAGQVVLPDWAFALAALFSAMLFAGVLRFLTQLAKTHSAPTPHSPLPIPHSPSPTPHSPLPIPHSPLPTPHSPLPIPHSPFPIPHSPFPIPHSPAPTPRLHLALLAAAPALMFLSIVRYSAIALGTDQVRLMFPALSALAVWAGIGVVGLADWLRRGKEGAGVSDRRIVAGFAGGMSLFALAVLLGVIRPGFAPPEPIAGAGSQPAVLLSAFGPLELVASELPQQAAAVGEPIPVRLWWRAGSSSMDDLRPAVRLVHSDGWLAGEWSHAPAGGRHSADRWQEGEVYEDLFWVLPDPGPAGVYTVEVGVRPFGGDWLPASGADDAQPFHPIGQVTVQ